MVKVKLFRKDFETQKEYENAIYKTTKELGDKRFGSKCEHLKTKNGYCLNCFRKVIDKL